MSDPIPQPVPLEQTRERIVAQLIDHFAAENLDDRGLEERLTKVYQLSTPAELQALVADLPVMRAAVPAASPAPAPARAEYVPERQVVAALMGGAERTGVWSPPQELWVVAVMGGAQLDFRQARFGAGVTEVNCFVLMGGVEIVVPPGVIVELNGLAIMGGFGQTGSAAPETDRDAPILRIGGFAMMGGVDVQVRYEHEKPSDARRREKLQREEHKRLQRGR